LAKKSGHVLLSRGQTFFSIGTARLALGGEITGERDKLLDRNIFGARRGVETGRLDQL
jgi:hypothetical protein